MSSDRKHCPFCFEDIHVRALKCKHCGSMLDGSVPFPRDTPAPARRVTPLPLGGAPAPGVEGASWRTSSGPLVPGTEVREYRIGQILGEGGMGAVYLAENRYTTQKVAIKVIWPELMRDENVSRRFVEEARVMGGLQHPNIVALHTFFEEGDRFFLVMALIEGTALDEILQSRRMELDEAVGIARQVLSALDYAHNRPHPVVHRDIKPANIMVRSDGTAVVTDFGIAKAAGREKLTRTQGVLGTYEYMSPEQVRGDPVTPACDLYSFGITFYRMLTGVVPFPQKTDGGFECMQAHVGTPAPPIAEFRDGLPAWVEVVLQRALAKQPDERYRTGGEMLNDLAGSRPPPIPAQPDHAVAPVMAPTRPPVQKNADPSHMPSTRLLSKIIVGPNSLCDFATIAEAIRNAAEGASISVLPGEYEEALTIDRPLEIVGAGGSAETIVASVGTPCVVMATEYAGLRNLVLKTTNEAKRKESSAVLIPQGQLVLEDCVVISEGECCIVVLGEGTAPAIRQCVIHGDEHGLLFGKMAQGTVEGSNIQARKGPGLIITGGADPTISRCRVSECGMHGVVVVGGGRGTIAETEITNNWGCGVYVASEGNPTLERCTLEGNSGKGIFVIGKREIRTLDCFFRHNADGPFNSETIV